MYPPPLETPTSFVETHKKGNQTQHLAKRPGPMAAARDPHRETYGGHTKARIGADHSLSIRRNRFTLLKCWKKQQVIYYYVA